MRPLLVRRFTATSSIGCGLEQTLESLRANRSGLAPCAFETVRLETHVGEVPGVEEVPLPGELARFACRNNRLAELGLNQDEFIAAARASIGRHGPRRVGLFLGTSTSGILATELAYRRRDPATGALPPDYDYAATHNTYSLGEYVRRRLGIEGPRAVISTACSSSAKAFGSAWRLIELGLIDAAVVGGVDSLCLTTLYGFHSLQLVSSAPCRPFDERRDGISIGEAAAFALIERTPSSLDADAILLTGIGESSDAHHMSSPHPQGRGAREAMQQALTSAGLTADEIDYLNLHGTGTPSNDAAEGLAVSHMFGGALRASSTKGATGHTLGAAGALEAAICALALERRVLPGGAGTEHIDSAVRFEYVPESCEDPRLERALSNSFGFGGSNCSLVLERSG